MCSNKKILLLILLYICYRGHCKSYSGKVEKNENRLEFDDKTSSGSAVPSSDPV